MTTSPTPGGRSGPVDRVTDYLLDVDGDIYGDERERVLWYEGISIAASFQWIAVPWALAVLVWFADRATVPILVAVLVVFYVPILFTTAYVRRRGARLLPRRLSAKYWLFGLLMGLPYVVFTMGALAVWDGESLRDGSWSGALVGGLVGAALGTIALVYTERRRRRAEDAAADGDE